MTQQASLCTAGASSTSCSGPGQQAAQCTDCMTVHAMYERPCSTTPKSNAISASADHALRGQQRQG